MAISLPLGSGNTGTNDWSDVYNNDAQLVTEIDARDDNYQTIFSQSGTVANDATAGTFLLGSATATGYGWKSANSENLSSGGTLLPPGIFYFDDADYTIASKTQKLRVRAQVAANAQAPAINFTFGLYPLTVAGSTDALTFTAGTVVSGSTALFTTPSASTIAQANSGDFTIPADGAYGLAVLTSGTIANASAVAVSAQLQVRWV